MIEDNRKYKEFPKEYEGKYKKCKKCGCEKEYRDFYFYKKFYSNGEKYYYFHPRCKSCDKESAYIWGVENVEKKRLSSKKNSKTPNMVKFHKYNSQRQRDSGYRKAWEQSEAGVKSKLKSLKSRMNKNHQITTKEWLSCKEYFKDIDGEWACAYCGLKAKNHYKKYKGKLKLQDLHKEHVDHNGSNTLDNCIPSCNVCNSSKLTLTLESWFNINNPNFTQKRLDKIIKWISEDYKIYIEKSK